ncbi:DUF2975 domain-containing protein [Aeromicrobium phragmitis]|uniref:DUF2975 domain-containing protein n=1 Tax=Aeromicrobium phragmitis TaxID=2478914 RepID=A0A3L8PK14_9ACTN|nr:DUF2975 domain-containing protein [Aeromicrobium phragmitis]RLV55697.1 DUF2975 domain-containing protein [Aeromicrobium phragmitis]
MSEKSPFGASRSDLWAVLIVGGVIVVSTLVGLVVRLVEIVPNRDVPVTVQLMGERLALPLGPNGEPLSGEVSTATIQVSDMPVATYVSALGAAIVPALATIGVVVCVMVLCRNLMAGRFFSRANTRLVSAVSVLIALGWLISFLFSTMASNGALALVADRELLESVQFRVDWVAVLAAMGVGALASAFHAGERMQRDTEGLV